MVRTVQTETNPIVLTIWHMEDNQPDDERIYGTSLLLLEPENMQGFKFWISPISEIAQRLFHMSINTVNTKSYVT